MASKCILGFATIYATEYQSCTAHSTFEFHGCRPYDFVAGETPDRTEWLEFDFYKPVLYYSPAEFPEERKLL